MNLIYQRVSTSKHSGMACEEIWTQLHLHLSPIYKMCETSEVLS